MRKIIFTIVFCFIGTSLFSQTLDRGTYMVGGSINYSSSSTEGAENSINEFTFAPRGGYFFLKNLYTGMSVIYKSYSYGENSKSTIGIGPVVRYYIDINKFKPFAGIGYIYKKSYNITCDSETVKTNFILSGGVDYFINNFFALELSANYGFTGNSYISGNYIGESSGNTFNVLLGANYFIK